MGKLACVAPEVRDRLAVRFGSEVLAWCDELSALVDELAARWELALVGSGGGRRRLTCHRSECAWARRAVLPGEQLSVGELADVRSARTDFRAL
ncbi:hypothetical protein B5181_34135 [Streptomyces sp. 4F]|nr:hypothetical protein B5181_34135 [Streptomyces sp. 4F]